MITFRDWVKNNYPELTEIWNSDEFDNWVASGESEEEDKKKKTTSSLVKPQEKPQDKIKKKLDKKILKKQKK